jgi:hypothetical protein
MIVIASTESPRLAAAVCAAALALSPAAAQAFERTPFGAQLPTTKNPCASYGAGYESVGGSTCVKIGGRVHVEAGLGASDWRVAPSAGAATRAAAPDLGVGAAHGAPSHLRLPRRY